MMLIAGLTLAATALALIGGLVTALQALDDMRFGLFRLAAKEAAYASVGLAGAAGGFWLLAMWTVG